MVVKTAPGAQLRIARHFSGGEPLETEIRPVGTAEIPADCSSVPTGRIQGLNTNPALKRRAIFNIRPGPLEVRGTPQTSVLGICLAIDESQLVAIPPRFSRTF
jgi:hypothetical protein